jgi:hypothetical protein
VPWTSIRDSQSAFISSCYLPAGGKIKDPSKLKASEIDSVLQFWSTRQQAGQEVFLFKQWQDNDKEMRRPVQEHSTDESGSEAPSGKPTKVALPAARGTGKRRSTKRQVVDSDSEAASNSDDNQGKSTLYLSSKYHTDTVPVVPPPKPHGKSGKQQTSLPPVQSKPAARQASVTPESKSPLYG